MTMLLAIDPGTTQSAGVLYDTETRLPIKWAKAENEEVLAQLDYTAATELAIEMIANYGMSVGAETFETCVWVGRFIERWLRLRSTRMEPIRIYRREVKLHLCGSVRANDSNVRQALIDRYGPGRQKAKGTKASPGPLHGFKADCWQALALAITAAEASWRRDLEAAA